MAVMMISYQWVLENVEEDMMTVSSKMISFQGEQVFRVGLKKTTSAPNNSSTILFFLAINLQKIGMRVREVVFSSQNIETLLMTPKTDDSKGSLQFYTSPLNEKIVGQRTFIFRVCIEGSVADYSYRLSDRLLKDQLWTAVVQDKHWTDIELVVKDKRFSVHKAILAARSRVFAAEFHAMKQEAGKNSPRQIQIDIADSSTVEQFLHFIYTGESNKSMANQQLLKLAKTYGIATLERLCEKALKKIEMELLASVVINLHVSDVESKHSAFEIRPEEDTETNFDPNTFQFLCDIGFEKLPSSTEYSVSKVFEHQNEKLFFVNILSSFESPMKPVTGGIKRPVNLYGSYDSSPMPAKQSMFTRSSTNIYSLSFFCANVNNIGCKVIEVSFSLKFCDGKKGNSSSTTWMKMKQKNPRNAGLLLLFTAPINPSVEPPFVVSFSVKMTGSIQNYRHELMDTTWSEQLWSSAKNCELTDVEVWVGSNKLEAHRVVLSARSPVFNALLNRINSATSHPINHEDNNDVLKFSISIGGDFDFVIVQQFVAFLYTGNLDISPANVQLLELAKMYEVETLKKICQLANQIPNADEITTSLLTV